MFNYRWSCFKHYQYNSESCGNVRMRLYNNSNLESYRFLGNSRIGQVESAKNRLAEVTEAMDFDDKEVDSLDEALDALEDAIDIMTDALEE